MKLFIVNPASGNGHALNHWKQLQLILDQKTVDYQMVLCTDIATTQRTIEERIHTLPIDAVVVIGGDGTINGVVQVLAYLDIPLAVIPSGSGNDICRNFALSNEPNAFVEKLLERSIVSVDLLRVNDRYGVTVAGIGLDAKIGARAETSTYKKWLNHMNKGAFAYTVAACIEFFLYKPFTATMKIDGVERTISKLWLLAVGNCSTYGGGMVICPDADPTDGFLQLTMLHSATRQKIITSLFPALLRGKKIVQEEVSYQSARQISIDANRIVPIVIDGEVHYSDRYAISIAQGALQVLLTGNQKDNLFIKKTLT
ncbi:diacylglycerol/lipid kinase family protein [Sporosarcina sp. ITBMC105]